MIKHPLTRLLLAATAAVAIAACGNGPEEPAADEPVAQLDAPEQAEPAVAAKAEEPAPIAAIEESDGSVDASEDEATESLRLARNDAPAAPATRFREGEHYEQWRPTRMTVTGTDGVEVVEVFWYGCSTCDKFEPLLKRWSSDLPEGVDFVKLPAVWNPTLEKHAQLYYTIEALAIDGKLENPAAVHQAVFDTIHREKRSAVTSNRDMVALVSRFGISEADFDRAWKSLWVNTRLNQAKRLNDTYDIGGVPTMVVNGKFVIRLKTTLESMLSVADELAAFEKTR